MAGVTGRDVQQQRSNEDEAAPSGYPRLLIVSHHRKGGGKIQTSLCQVTGCGAVVEENQARRLRTCEEHRKATCLDMSGVPSRFCQQCTLIHPLDHFDGTKRGCRRRLESRNSRRQQLTAARRSVLNEKSAKQMKGHADSFKRRLSLENTSYSDPECGDGYGTSQPGSPLTPTSNASWDTNTINARVVRIKSGLGSEPVIRPRVGHGDATPLIAPDDSRISSWYTESADFDYQQGMPNNASVHGSDFGGQLYRNGPGMKFDPWAQINIADASCLTVNLPAGKDNFDSAMCSPLTQDPYYETDSYASANTPLGHRFEPYFSAFGRHGW